jgi:hypothetical protein
MVAALAKLGYCVAGFWMLDGRGRRCATSHGPRDMRKCRARCADGDRAPHSMSAQASDRRERGPLNNAINRGHPLVTRLNALLHFRGNILSYVSC